MSYIKLVMYVNGNDPLPLRRLDYTTSVYYLDKDLYS
jgi:hypothetical protein